MFIISEGDDIIGMDFHIEKQFSGAERKETPIIKEAHRQLTEYFDGRRKYFDLPLKPAGTPFQLKVLDELAKVPYGERRTYGQLAAAAGNPKASRAVGMVMNRNPIAIILACHRIVGTDGKLVGYGGGLDRKVILLELEDLYK